MNLTLQKYDLMKKLGIKDCDHLYRDENEDDKWISGNSGEWFNDDYADCLLERPCRKYLETWGISILLTSDYDPSYRIFQQGIGCIMTYPSFDAAQIAALKHCLSEKQAP